MTVERTLSGLPTERTEVRFHSWSKKLLHNCGDAPWKNHVKGLFHGNIVSPLGVGQLYPLGYRPTPLLLGLPRGAGDLVVLGYAQI